MIQGLTSEYRNLLIALQQQPLATIEELAIKTERSLPTVAKRLRQLQGLDDISRGSKKQFFFVSPILDVGSLGLELLDVFVETSSFQDLKSVETLASKHPYTAYRGRCYGRVNGLHLQFRAPVGSREFIETLFSHLIELGTIKSFDIFLSEKCRSQYTSMRLEGWDSERMVWCFDWPKWFKQKVKSVDLTQFSTVTSDVPSWLSKKDAFIIQELMRGSRRKNLQMIDAIKREGVEITPQTFSRRYQQIKDECIKGFRLSYDPAAFDIYNTIMIRGEAKQAFLDGLSARIYHTPIPFDSTLKVCGNQMMWMIHIQSSHLSVLVSHLYSQLESMSVCMVDYPNSMGYPLWPDTFDDDTHKWRTGQKYMVDDVLDSSF